MRFLNQICLSVIMLCFACLLSLAQVSAEPNPEKTNEELELINAQIQNEKAQAAYYDEQTRKLKDAPPPKTVRQNIEENPASVLGVLGATFAAFVALLSFAFNYRATLRNQRDTQFYEALKRFGDKDSPTLRATAAAILSEMAAKEVYRFDIHKLRSFFTRKDWLYMNTVRDQLLTGLLFEESYAVIQVIISETLKLIHVDPSSRLLMISNANQHLRNELLKDIADFLALSNVEDPVDTNDKQWKVMSTTTRFSPAALKSLLEVYRMGFLDFLNSSQATLTNLTPAEKLGELSKVQKQLRLNAFRLRILIYLCSEALTKHAAYKAIPFDKKLFLGNINLAGVNLSGTQLEGSILSGAKLDGVNLSNANLRGAKFNNCSLVNTAFWETEIDDKTDFTEANWWRANFFSEDKKTLEGKTLTTLTNLVGRYGKPIATSEYHSSVKQFLESSEKPEGS